MLIFRFIGKLLPPIRIHTWGGLGSQLFALALLNDLKIDFPFRKTILVFHSSGESRRLPEIDNLLNINQYLFLDDFSRELDRTYILKKNRKATLSVITKCLRFIGFLASANDNNEYGLVKPWVLEIRGHYSQRSIRTNFLSEMASMLRFRYSPQLSLNSSTGVIHYRLGDLLNLSSKQPIETNSIAQELVKVSSEIGLTTFFVASDTLPVALQRLNSIGNIEFKSVDLDALDLMLFAMNARYFIGTSSKVSFWICAIRSRVLNSPSSLPAAFRGNVLSMNADSRFLQFY